MAIRLNHTIVAAHDKETAAKFLSEILGLSTPSLVGPFAAVRVSDDTSLDYIDADGEITSQHYAFLVDENEFDEIFERIRKRHLTYFGPTQAAASATRSTPGTAGAAYTSTTRTVTCWKFFSVHTAAVAQRRPDATPCSQLTPVPKITRVTTLLIKGRRAEAESDLRQAILNDMT